MQPATLRLVLLISCCHALVHIYELSFASVEQLVGLEFGVGKEVTGVLGSLLRLPFGLCALGAGWLADHLGAKRLLMLYLGGCSVASLIAWFSPTIGILGLAMFTMGLFASIYHPAGVGLISHHTNPNNRPMALGYHGILGSSGIAAGPFLAGMVLATGATWRQYYLFLSVPGILLALFLLYRIAGKDDFSRHHQSTASTDHPEDEARWRSYFVLLVVVALAGFVYAALLNFMPRYLDGAGLDLGGLSAEALRNYMTGVVLILGIVGQFTAGRLARPTTLEPLMALAFFAAAPCVFWMAFAPGAWRLAAAALFAPFFFMHQPLLNSAVAKYVPRRRRSLSYGLTFTCGFGIGSLGPTFAGYARSDLVNYGTLSALLCAAGVLAAVLWWQNGPEEPDGDAEISLPAEAGMEPP